MTVYFLMIIPFFAILISFLLLCYRLIKFAYSLHFTKIYMLYNFSCMLLQFSSVLYSCKKKKKKKKIITSLVEFQNKTCIHM